MYVLSLSHLPVDLIARGQEGLGRASLSVDVLPKGVDVGVGSFWAAARIGDEVL